jgi:uncharacterized membrane protein
MRGIVIVIMALDHVRDLLHTTSITQDPTNLANTTTALFFTRWITHLCAPIFVFLAGTSAYLMMKSQNNLQETRYFLLTRGLWLMLLEITVVSFGIWFDIYFRTMLLQVIFAIGFAFFVLSFLIRFGANTLGIIGLVIIGLHDLALGQKFENPVANFAYSLFLSPNFFPLSNQFTIAVMYPLLPWLGILLFGFAFGQVFELEDRKRQRILFQAGGVALLLFVVLRSYNFYGDVAPWAWQANPVFSFLSFINVSKYPPSLLFTAVTLGIMFLTLGIINSLNNGFTRLFTTYGRVPLFFYVGHWYIIHAVMFAILYLQGAWSQIKFGVFSFGRPATGVGIELPYIYLAWLSVILFFYPLCRWYGGYKAKHKENKWLSYL